MTKEITDSLMEAGVVGSFLVLTLAAIAYLWRSHREEISAWQVRHEGALRAAEERAREERREVAEQGREQLKLFMDFQEKQEADRNRQTDALRVAIDRMSERLAMQGGK